MRVAIINISGNVGKTTLAAHLFAPRNMPGLTIYAVGENESVSAMALPVHHVRPAQRSELANGLAASVNAIVDVASSAAWDVLAWLKADDAHEGIDLFVVPTASDEKVVHDTVRTVRTLLEMGVPPEHLRVVFNRVERGADMEDFAPILALAKQTSILVTPAAIVEENEVFDMLLAAKISMAEVLADATDYRAEIKKLRDSPAAREQVDRASQMLTMQGLSRYVNRQFDTLFSVLVAYPTS